MKQQHLWGAWLWQGGTLGNQIGMAELPAGPVPWR